MLSLKAQNIAVDQFDRSDPVEIGGKPDITLGDKKVSCWK
jgi:hypothetical protein